MSSAEDQVREITRQMSWRLNIWMYGRCPRCGNTFDDAFTKCTDHDDQVQAEFKRQYSKSQSEKAASVN